MDNNRNNEYFRLPPIKTEPYPQASTESRIPSGMGLPPLSHLPPIGRPVYRPIYTRGLSTSAPDEYTHPLSHGMTQQHSAHIETMSSPNPTEGSIVSDPNVDPRILEKRRRNASASARSRTRRRVRELEMQQRNEVLEAHAEELNKGNQELRISLERLNRENFELKSRVDAMEESREQDRANLSFYRSQYSRLNAQGASPSELERINEALNGRWEAEDRYSKLYETYSQLHSTVRSYEERIRELESTYNRP